MPEVANAGSHPLDTMLAASDVITNWRLARIYARVLNQGTPTVKKSQIHSTVLPTTVYENVRRLTNVGLLSHVTETQPHRYQANRLTMTVQTGDDSYEITATLVVALARSDTNENIGLLWIDTVLPILRRRLTMREATSVDA